MPTQTKAIATLGKLLLTALALLLAASGHRAFVTVPVTVDGHRVAARAGASVAEVTALTSVARPGDVLAAADRRVIATGTGEPVMVLVNGRLADASELVQPGDRLTAYSGPDEVEPTVVETRTVQAPPQVIGVGPVEHVIQPGTAGLARVTVGTVSGDVVATETITAARAGLVRRVPAPGAKVVALTFDDGPWPTQTDAILEVLNDRGVPATFFMIGSRVKAAPDIARRVAAEGHVIGNHTYRHVHLDSAEPKVVRREIVGTNRIIAETTGVTPLWFRAPGGKVSSQVFAELKREGLRSALWTVDPQDWRDKTRASAIANGVVAAARPGAVILLHDGGGDQSETVKALPWIIDRLRADGYEFVTLEEMERVKASW